jgi:glutamate dehydrogenase
MGIDIQSTDFTVVGIGDMSGDVFGNGMLLSEHIRLTAAFNHLHIFIDPSPDAATSFLERKRLFELPRSSWADYSAELISEGGGVFDRSAKSIAITPQMRETFGIAEHRLAPDLLIQALLKAPMDLLWNGGIGTYVKSSHESHTDIGDKANDSVRVDARQLGVKVVGEGGNLGLSQLARVEYALAGGSVNTDFIDNAGGVNCSDHEVNIKILLDEQVRNGDLTTKQRNQLLEQMTDEVADLVLKGNDRQSLALSVAQWRAARGMEEFIRFIQSLCATGELNRQLEFIPEDDVLRERRNEDKGFTRPELAVLSAYSKSQLKKSLVTSKSLLQDSVIASSVMEAAPSLITERYRNALEKHALRAEMVAMGLANKMIDSGGITFAHRMRESTGAADDAIAKAFIFARSVFRLDQMIGEVNALNYKVDSANQYQMLDTITGLVRGGTRWFLRGQRNEKPLAGQIDVFSASVREVWDNLSLFLEGSMEAFWNDAYNQCISVGVDEGLASFVAGGPILYAGLNIAEATQKVSGTTLDVARMFFRIGEDLGLTEFSRKVYDMKVQNHWQAIAREGLIDDIAAEQKAITIMVLSCPGAADLEVSECLSNWIETRQTLVTRWRSALAELKTAPGVEFAMYSVVLRELANLTRVEAA